MSKDTDYPVVVGINEDDEDLLLLYIHVVNNK